MSKRKWGINGIINIVEGYGDSMLGSDDSGVWADVQLVFWMLVCFGVFLYDSSKLFGVLALVLFFVFIFKMRWRYKNRHNHPARNLLFFETEDEEYDVLLDRHNYDEKAREYYKVLGTKNVAITHEVQHTACTSTNRDHSDSADSWDIKDPKPPWEL